MNWENLRIAFGKLKPEGPKGFEGLCARLFEAETGEPFYLARTGDQPAGDAYGPNAGIAIQAKRYTTGRISENNVEGDVHRLLREAPQTDTFVVVALRADNQLELRLENVTKETGVDAILLALDDKASPLGALCVNHWDIIREFCPAWDASADQWAKDQVSSNQVAEQLALLRKMLSGMATQEIVSQQASTKLKLRMEGGSLGSRRHNRVDLASNVSRPAIRVALKDWWKKTDSPVSIVEGEEGNGKTWIAAEFAIGLVGDSQVVLWLDSLAWCDAASVEDILRAGLQNLYRDGDDRIPRIIKKILERWRGSILVVLDGANERNAWTAANRILDNYDQHAADFSGRVRIIFTSRPLKNYLTVAPNLWGNACIIPAGPFDDSEMAAALTKFAPEVEPQALTSAVMELARVPRYFRLCIRLRERLASLHHLNREILLWADLEAKWEAGDPQWINVQKSVGKSLTEILADLALRSSWPDGKAVPISARELEDFRQVRTDLIDQRIVLKAIPLGQQHLSAEHVILGWGLILQQTAVGCGGQSADDILDHLERFLEPAASNDNKARAVHVAALLEFMNSSSSSSAVREALLRLWISHHNAAITSETLSFFLRTDLSAYIQMVEAFFRKYLPGNFETTLVAPLAIQWRDGGEDQPVLNGTLVRWLRFIFPGDASGSEDGTECPPLHFVPSATREQLRLSYAAASIVSTRPTFDLLTALIDCYESDRFCYEDSPHPKVISRWEIKSSWNALGVLLRWHYQEAGLRKLVKLAEEERVTTKRQNDLFWFAKLWRMAQLPPLLGEPEDIVRWTPEDDRESFRSLQKALSSPEAKEGDIFGIDVTERLAIRRDLPSLSSVEISKVIEETTGRLKYIYYKNYSNTWEDHGLRNRLPYLARYSSAVLQQTLQTLWRAAINAADSTERILTLNKTLPAKDDGGELVASIMQWAATLDANSEKTWEATAFTEILLLHAPTEILIQWFEKLVVLRNRRSGLVLSLHLFHFTLERLAPDDFEEAVRNKVINAVKDLDQTPNEHTRRRVGHWLHIYAYVAKAISPELGAWALELVDRYGTQEDFLHPLFLLASRCPNAEIFRRALSHRAFQDYHHGYNAWRWITAFPNDRWPTFTWSELKEVCSLTVAGWLLYASKQDDELRAWGHEFSEAALKALSGDPLPLPKTHIKVEVNCRGRLEKTGFETRLEGKQTWRGVTSPGWGVDRQVQCPAPEQKDLDRELEAFKDDVDELRSPRHRDFTDFNAASPLRHWGKIAPDDFASWAKDFLTRFAQAKPARKLNLQFFAVTVEEELLRASPEFILVTSTSSSITSHVKIACYSGTVDIRDAALWKAGLNHFPEVTAERRRRFLEALNDEEILWNVLAAHAGGNAVEIAALSAEWLASSFARERALAVSLLAFHGDAGAFSKLQAVREFDPSFWVREHARWAVDACATEIAVRKRYRELLSAESLEEVSAAIAELCPALSPMAFAWRRSEENRAFLGNQSPRNRAVIELFWYHIDHSSWLRQNPSIAGRKLKDFCRGERLKDEITSRMAPWWTPR